MLLASRSKSNLADFCKTTAKILQKYTRIESDNPQRDAGFINDWPARSRHPELLSNSPSYQQNQ